MKRIIKLVSDYLLQICVTLAVLGVLILFRLPIERMSIVPHIITYASCNLALIGFIFSLLLGLKGGYIYKQLTKKYKDTAQRIYWRVFYISCASSAAALISIAIIVVEEWVKWAKYVCAGILLFVFLYMVLGTISVLGILIQLMIDEFPKMKDNGHI